MVLRYWGDTRVTAEDFAGLVDRSVGGIRTGDLVTALRARASHVVAAAGTSALAQSELAAGRPVIALVEDRPGAFHYVVVVGWHERAVVAHDPARTPYLVMQPADFERRWKASGNWMLAMSPRFGESFNPDPATPRLEGAAASTACDALVADGVRYAQQNDLTSAERLLADAAYQCAGVAPLRELAGVRLLQRRWPEVRDLSARAVAVDPADAHAWRLLATGRYIGGDLAGALDAWNHAGEPMVDLVIASGLQRTTHRAVERVIALESGEILTRADLERARRRLDELPAAFSTRLAYVARAGGRAEVRAHVAEQPVVPRSRLAWALMGARAAASREIAVGINSLAQRGERLEARWRFWPHRPAYGIAMTVPAGAVGILTVEGFTEEQPFTAADIAAAERAGARAQIADWASGTVRWHVRTGVDRWVREGTFGVIGGGTHVVRGRTEILLDTDTWLGHDQFATGRVTGRWSSADAPRRTVFVVRGGLEAVSASTPPDLWAAADTGHVRAPLLRAHPLVADGRFDMERLGRHVAHVSGEAQRWRRAPGPVAVGAALFVDTARTGGRHAGRARTDVDAGIGLRIAIPGHRGLFRADFAHGVRDGRNAFSLAWQP